MELKDIKIIIDLMKKNDLSVFEMEEGDFKIKLKRGGPAESHAAPAGPAPVIYHHPPAALTLPPAAPGVPTAAETPAAAPPATPAAASGPEIKSPMVGTYYSAMSPDSPPYVKVGQSVTADTVVCIVEAMKVMNEIKAEQSGVIAEVLAENGKPVQFGQALFRLQ